MTIFIFEPCARTERDELVRTRDHTADPGFHAQLARRRTWSSIEESTPISRNVASSTLVKTVTPRSNNFGPARADRRFNHGAPSAEMNGEHFHA